jgi:hypothetical protein
LKVAHYILAVFFSLMLIVDQVVPAFGFSDTTETACCIVCDCDMAECCMAAPSSGDSQSAPAIPVRTTSFSDWQALSLVLQQWISAPRIESQPPVFAGFSFPLQTIVPLYTRDCSYLI